jgi:IS1 family transposase
MNKLTTIDRANILNALVEGNSIASCTRMFGASKVTILRLLADAGTLALKHHNIVVRDLATKNVQMDEVWSFVHSKDKNVQPKNWGKGVGSVWTWVAMDSDSKLVINWHVGGRDQGAGTIFVCDLADRLANRVQLTSDGLAAYRESVKRAFGEEVDYATLVKVYAHENAGFARYSPSKVVSCHATVMSGDPIESEINTSYIERQNLSVRMGMRRFTRLTNGFSKKLTNHKHMIALYYFHYNFCRKHMTINMTPAAMSGITDRTWTMIDFVEMLERAEHENGGRLTDYKMAASKRRVLAC